jgi:hypothetical protein
MSHHHFDDFCPVFFMASFQCSSSNLIELLPMSFGEELIPLTKLEECFSTLIRNFFGSPSLNVKMSSLISVSSLLVNVSLIWCSFYLAWLTLKIAFDCRLVDFRD